MPINLKFNKEAREKLLVGIKKVSRAVGSTLGPKGRNVAINEAYGAPRIIHDGVSVAKRVDLFDEFEDMGAQLLKEAAIKTNDIAGDGTTTATVIAHALAEAGIADIQAGLNPMTLKAEIEEARDIALTELKKLAREIKDNSDVERVASISSADPEIGRIVAEAIKKTGDDGLVMTEEGKGIKTEVEYKSGLEFDRGYASSSAYFVNNQDTAEAVIEDAYILMTDIKINHNHQIVPFLEKVLKTTKNIVIIGEVQEEALATLVVNRLRGGLNILSVQAPAFGERKVDELEDIAALVGGVVIREDSGRDIANVEIDELGRADKVVANQDSTKIQGGRGDKARLKERTEHIKNQIGVANTEYDREIKEQRLAKLIGGVAIIKVGAINEIELADKKERVIDAVNSAKASIEEGIVAGGQIAFLTISQMDVWPDTVGARILREAIKRPFKILMENAGYDYAECLGKITPIKYPVAIDVMDGKVKDMIEAGIVDPLKVCRSALENAVSVAGMAYTTACLISEPYRETK